MGRASVTGAMDSRLRTVALVLTALVILQVVWIGVRLSLMEDPEPILPAESSLNVRSVAYIGADPIQAGAVRARPLFWQGREAFVALGEEPEVEIVASGPDNKLIQGVKLLGVYGSGPSAGLIVMNNGERARVRTGDKIGDWQFTTMSADGAIFEAGDESRILELTHAVPSAKGAKGKAAKTKRANARRRKSAGSKK